MFPAAGHLLGVWFRPLELRHLSVALPHCAPEFWSYILKLTNLAAKDDYFRAKICELCLNPTPQQDHNQPNRTYVRLCSMCSLTIRFSTHQDRTFLLDLQQTNLATPLLSITGRLFVLEPAFTHTYSFVHDILHRHKSVNFPAHLRRIFGHNLYDKFINPLLTSTQQPRNPPTFKLAPLTGGKRKRFLKPPKLTKTLILDIFASVASATDGMAALVKELRECDLLGKSREVSEQIEGKLKEMTCLVAHPSFYPFGIHLVQMTRMEGIESQEDKQCMWEAARWAVEELMAEDSDIECTAAEAIRRMYPKRMRLNRRERVGESEEEQDGQGKVINVQAEESDRYYPRESASLSERAARARIESQAAWTQLQILLTKENM